MYKTDEKWNSGIELGEYNGKYSLDAVYENKSGDVKKKFMFVIQKDNTAGKMMPVRVDLGDRQTAIKTLQDILRCEFGVNLSGSDDVEF